MTETLALPLLELKHSETPKRRKRQEITDQILQLVFEGRTNFTEIAKKVGVGRVTAYRYWNRWKQTEEARQVDQEWWSLYNTVKHENPTKALECLTRIKHRMTTEKVEVDQTVRQIRLTASWNNKYNAQPQTTTVPIKDS